MSTPITIICGPTGSGKTTLALKMAGIKPTSIISADSRQVYEGLDIITGKDLPASAILKKSTLLFHGRSVVYFEIGEIRLWGFNLLKPNESFNAADFVTLTNQIIARETTEKRQIIIVGGTGFYLKAITQPQTLAHVPPSDQLRQKLSLLSTADLQQRLWEIDPQKFLSLNDSDNQNPRRLLRAIEIATSPDSPSPYQGEGRGEVSFYWLGLRPPLEQLKEKIHTRVLARLENGAIAEVEKLLKEYPDQSLPIYTSLGIKQIIQFLHHDTSREQLIELWTTDEINYAKRQITWFKKQPQIRWLTADH